VADTKDSKTPNLTWEAFLDFDKKIQGPEMKMIKNDKKYTKRDFERLELKPPRKIVGRETGYFFEANGYKVKVWTTILEDQKKPRDKGEDVGWVLIVKGDVLIHCSKPFLRTSDEFFTRILKTAWISRYKILNIPNCRECKRKMEIVRNTKTNQTYFSCSNVEHHSEKKNIRESWDKPIEGKTLALKFIEGRRKQTADYKKRNKKLGLNPTPKAKIRKKWEIGRPENLKK
jgi:hypothetical protein